MTQKITLTALQNKKLFFLLDQLNAIERERRELIQFIADAHGHTIDPKGKWNVNESVLEVDVLPQIELVK
jgi:hypothetical protein